MFVTAMANSCRDGERWAVEAAIACGGSAATF
jgi:hypothetical protein